MKWYLKAAEQDYASSQIKLGFLYARGLGVPHDNVLAYMWFDISEYLILSPNTKEKITEVMTSAEIKEAKELAEIWKKKHRK